MTDYIQQTIDLARENVKAGGRPFSCLIVRGDKIIAKACNQVAQTHDPTAHAEMLAIREASKLLQSEHMRDCEFYILAHPCPMCLAAMYYCSPKKVTFITTREDYGQYYTDDRKYFTLNNFYSEIAKPWQERHMPMVQHENAKGIAVYALWAKLNQAD